MIQQIFVQEDSKAVQATETVAAEALPMMPTTPQAQAQLAESPLATSSLQHSELSPSPITAASLIQSPSFLAGHSPDMGHGSSWNRTIGGRTMKTVANLTIPGDLSKEQEKIFMELLNNYMSVYAKDKALNTSDLVDKIQVAWRDENFKTILLNDFGLGGLLSPKNIKRLLRKYGTKVSMGGMNIEAKFPALESTDWCGRHHSSPRVVAKCNGTWISIFQSNTKNYKSPMSRYVGHPCVFPSALLPGPRNAMLHSSALSSDSAASANPSSRTTTVTHAYLNSYQNDILQKALRKIWAPPKRVLANIESKGVP